MYKHWTGIRFQHKPLCHVMLCLRLDLLSFCTSVCLLVIVFGCPDVAAKDLIQEEMISRMSPCFSGKRVTQKHGRWVHIVSETCAVRKAEPEQSHGARLVTRWKSFTVTWYTIYMYYSQCFTPQWVADHGERHTIHCTPQARQNSLVTVPENQWRRYKNNKTLWGQFRWV